MRPLTDTQPKPLLKVGGMHLIEYHIKALVDAGITDIVINHAWLGDQLVSSIGNGGRYGATIHYSAEDNLGLETGGGIYQALPLLGDSPFIVINGDIWCDYPISDLLDRPVNKAHLVLVDNPEHNPEGDFHLAAGMVDPEGEPRLTFSGIGIYRHTLFVTCQPGRFPLAPLLREAMGEQQVSGEHYQGRWLDIGTPERLKQLDDELCKVSE